MSPGMHPKLGFSPALHDTIVRGHLGCSTGSTVALRPAGQCGVFLPWCCQSKCSWLCNSAQLKLPPTVILHTTDNTPSCGSVCPACLPVLPTCLLLLQYEEFLQALHKELPVLANPPHHGAAHRGQAAQHQAGMLEGAAGH